MADGEGDGGCGWIAEEVENDTDEVDGMLGRPPVPPLAPPESDRDSWRCCGLL